MPPQPPAGPGAWGPAPAPEAAQPEKKGKGAAIWIVAAILALLVIGGVVAFALGLFDSSSVTDAAVDECVIEADGTMIAKGWVTADERVTLAVRFQDADSGTELDRATVTPRGSVDERQSWTAQGSTDDDEVQKVTCVLEDAG
jgi:hypothetical protein